VELNNIPRHLGRTSAVLVGIAGIALLLILVAFALGMLGGVVAEGFEVVHE
jgi:hypothetical protein